jgi:effector-binding domain-containing protein
MKFAERPYPCRNTWSGLPGRRAIANLGATREGDDGPCLPLFKKELKLAEMPDFAVASITELFQKATELKLGQGGPVMFTYYNFMGDPDQKFTAEIALPIHKKEVEQSGGPYLRETTKFKCASAIYQGPLNKIGDAWGAFVSGAMQKGEPTGESRELFLYYESAESPNNIVELQMGLK